MYKITLVTPKTTSSLRINEISHSQPSSLICLLRKKLNSNFFSFYQSQFQSGHYMLNLFPHFLLLILCTPTSDLSDVTVLAKNSAVRYIGLLRSMPETLENPFYFKCYPIALTVICRPMQTIDSCGILLYVLFPVSSLITFCETIKQMLQRLRVVCSRQYFVVVSSDF